MISASSPDSSVTGMRRPPGHSPVWRRAARRSAPSGSIAAPTSGGTSTGFGSTVRRDHSTRWWHRPGLVELGPHEDPRSLDPDPLPPPGIGVGQAQAADEHEGKGDTGEDQQEPEKGLDPRTDGDAGDEQEPGDEDRPPHHGRRRGGAHRRRLLVGQRDLLEVQTVAGASASAESRSMSAHVRPSPAHSASKAASAASVKPWRVRNW